MLYPAGSRRRRRRRVGLQPGGVAAAYPFAPQHDYLLQGSLADVYSGPSLVGTGGLVTANGWVYDSTKTLLLPNVLTTGIYTVAIEHRTTTLGPGFQKIFDFKSGTVDYGAYMSDDRRAYIYYDDGSPESVELYGNDVVYDDLAPHYTVITRDGRGVYRHYVDGVQQLFFNDSAFQNTVATEFANNFYIFTDEPGINADYMMPGIITRIRTWSVALPPEHVAALDDIPIRVLTMFDDFNRANTLTLGAPVVGPTPTISGMIGIQSNFMYTTSTGGAFWNIGGAGDMYFEFVVGAMPVPLFFTIRVSEILETESIYFIADATGVHMHEYDSSLTPPDDDIATDSPRVLVPGDLVTVIASGLNVRVRVNNQIIINKNVAKVFPSRNVSIGLDAGNTINWVRAWNRV